MIYETVIETPQDADALSRVVDLVRGVAWPRIHITIEARDRVELREKVDDLSCEMQSWGLAGIDDEQFSRGVQGTLDKAMTR